MEGSKISHIESVVMVKRSHEADSYPSKRTRRSVAHEEAWSDVAHSESSADGMKIRISLPKKSQGVMTSTSSLSLSSQASQTSAVLMDGKEEKMEEEEKRGNGETEQGKEENAEVNEPKVEEKEGKPEEKSKEESEENPEEKSEEKIEEEKQEKPEEKPEEKIEEKQEEPEENHAEKPEEKPEEKSEEKSEENPEEKPAVQEESKESKDPVSGISLSPKKKKLAPAELVIMCVSGSRLHIWPLPDLPSLKQGTKSLCIDLAVFVPGLSIEDVAFLDGFDKEGRIVGVAGAGGVVLILNCRKQELLWKVPAGKGVFGSWTARTRPTCTA